MTAEAVAAVCRACGLDPDGRQVGALVRYLELLHRWNATYNLTAVRDPAAMLVQHLADCVAVVPPLQRRIRGGRVLDVGSGGGLPGVVIAILLADVDVTCVDAVGKKAAFIRQVAGRAGLSNLHAVHARVEALDAPPFDVVTARAFASLSHFVAWTERSLAPDGVWMAMKGRRPDDEIAALAPSIDVFHVEQLVVPRLDGERCLVWMQRRADAPESALPSTD